MIVLSVFGLMLFGGCLVGMASSRSSIHLCLVGVVLGIIISGVGFSALFTEEYNRLDQACKSKGDNVLIKSGKHDYVCIKRTALG